MKNSRFHSIMLRNNIYSDTLSFFNTNKDFHPTKTEFDKIKYDISTTTNIINEYKKLSKRKIANKDFQPSKANSLYNRNRKSEVNKDKEFNSEVNTAGIISINKNIFKKRLNNDFYNNIIKSQNLSNNQKNFYNNDSDHSSMDTIKKILYSTDSKKEVKRDKINSELKTSQLNDFPSIKNLLNNLKVLTKRSQKDITSLEKANNDKEKEKINIDEYNKKSRIKKGSKQIDKNLLNIINKELTFNKKNAALMKFLKTKNNYDYDKADNSLNISDELQTDNIKEKKYFDFKNNIYNNNNNNYTFRKIHNNINININNDINNIKTNNKQNQNIKINNDILPDKSSIKKFNNIDINIFDDINNDKENLEKKDEISSLKEKIKELNEEIKNKNLLINEYSNLAKQSKLKFAHLISQNKQFIEKMQKDNKKQNMIYKYKITSIEKEKENILNKYVESKKYSEFLEGLLFDQNNFVNNDINKCEENNKIKNIGEIVKKLMNDISKLKIELDNKKLENEKLRNIINKYKDKKAYREVINSRNNINFLEKTNNIHLNNNFENKNDNNHKDENNDDKNNENNK